MTKALSAGMKVLAPSGPAIIVGWDEHWQMWRIRYRCGFEFAYPADELSVRPEDLERPIEEEQGD